MLIYINRLSKKKNMTALTMACSILLSISDSEPLHSTVKKISI